MSRAIDHLAPWDAATFGLDRHLVGPTPSDGNAPWERRGMTVEEWLDLSPSFVGRSA